MMKNLQTYEDFVLESLVLEAASSKDIQRIQDIITKSGGSEDKMLTLANTMCKLITDKNKAFDRALAATQILGDDHPVTKIFMDRSAALGVNIEDKITQGKILPGSKRPSSEQLAGNPGYEGFSAKGSMGGIKHIPILPCGSLNLSTGQNKYFNVKDEYQINSTLEVWEDQDGKYRIISTSGSNPSFKIRTSRSFMHDQTRRPLFYAIMVDFIEAAHSEVLIPMYGKSLPMYVYK